jgi:hypothetical protein
VHLLPSEESRERPVVDLLPAIAALSRGDAIDPDGLLDAGGDVVGIAERHGLAPLLAERAAGHPALAALAAALAVRARTQAAADLVAEQALRESLNALHRASVPTLVFKGAQLAYLCYERPHLRPRLDSDLLIRPGDRERAGRALLDLGYQLASQVEADLIMFQQMFVLGDPRSPRHVIDLHWRVTNPHEFGTSFDVDALFARAVDLPALGPSARGLAVADALMVSLVHPVAHHGGAARVIWDLDTAALVRQMTASDWQACIDRLDTPRLAAIAVVRLERAREWGGATLDAAALSALRQRATPAELAALRAPSRAEPEWRAFTTGLRALPRWRDRARFLGQHLAPSAEYMRDVYAPGSRAPLPALYAQRAVRGLSRWLGLARQQRRPA